MGVGMWDPSDETNYCLHKPLIAPDETPKYTAGSRARPTTDRKGSFPAAYWNPDFLALITVAEFARKREDWRKLAIDPPPDEAETLREIDYLIGLAKTERSDARVKEIIAQHAGFLGYYLDLLMITPGSYPATYLVIKIGCRVAELTMAYYKAMFNRARPSQLRPDLMPPVPVQGHPSYPSGHSLTAHLISLCLSEVCSANRAALFSLADRIAVNREVAGFHYPSDTAAGRAIAEQSYQLLETCRAFTQARNAAKAEWADRSAIKRAAYRRSAKSPPRP
jgi:acid phosphatase (class A)